MKTRPSKYEPKPNANTTKPKLPRHAMMVAMSPAQCNKGQDVPERLIRRHANTQTKKETNEETEINKQLLQTTARQKTNQQQNTTKQTNKHKSRPTDRQAGRQTY